MQNQKTEYSARTHSEKAVIGVDQAVRKYTGETPTYIGAWTEGFLMETLGGQGPMGAKVSNTYHCACMYWEPNKYVLEGEGGSKRGKEGERKVGFRA